MKCFECTEKGDENPRKAEYLLVDYDRVVPICETCLDEVLYMEGEINVDSYYIGFDLTGAIRRINRILKYHQEMIERYSNRYFGAKKMGEDCHKRNVKIAPEALLRVLEWE